MLRMNRRVVLFTAACVLIGGCAGRQDDFGFARQPQLKSGATAKGSKRHQKAAEPPRILPETHYAAGRVFEQQGSPEKAIEQYRKAVAVNHKYTAAYARLGLMLSVAGQHEEAVDAFTQAVELKPGSAILQNNLGFEHLYLERWDDAERHLRQAVKLDPKLPQAHINLGLLLGRTERYELALESFRRVLPEPDANYNLGLLHRAQGRFALASECFQRVLAMNPEFTAARRQLTEVDNKIVTAPATDPIPEILAAQHQPTPDHDSAVAAIEEQQRTVPSATKSNEIVDLQNLIDQMIPHQTAPQPEVRTVESTDTEPTVRTIQQSIEVSGPTTQSGSIEHQTLVMGMETIKPIEYFEEPTMPNVGPTSTTTLPQAAVVEPTVHENELNLKEVARTQNLAEKPGHEVEPVQPVDPTSSRIQPLDVIPGSPAPLNGEVVLVLAESETRENPELPVEQKQPAASAEPTIQNARILDDMEVSLQVLRNEVHCLKESDGTLPNASANAAGITDMTPVVQESAPDGQASAWDDEFQVEAPIEGSMKVTVDQDPLVARMPVTAIQEVPDTNIASPALGSTPPTQGPEVQSSGRFGKKSKERSRTRD